MKQTTMKVLFAVVATLMMTACHQFDARTGIAPQPEVQAAKAVGDSFAVQNLPASDLSVNKDQAQITLKKSALEKEFLLMGSMIVQQPIPSFSGIKSRVVAFRLMNEKLYLMDANQGHQITKSLPQNLLLTEFPIISQNDDSVTFDFNAGMASIYTQGDWFSEDEGKDYKYDLDHFKVLSSYISAAKLSQSSNILTIDQISQVEGTDDSGKTQTQPAAVRYYLSPYQPDPNFAPKVSEGMKTYGFFEVSPQLASDGSSFIRLAKWDTQRPIVYAISANTPKDFRQAVADSVLYWNHIIGKEVLQVIQLEDASLTAPNPDYNIIQWVENEAAGFAFADAQMDPRSGQVLHAQIYLTSVFGTLGKVRAERDLRDDGSGQSARMTLKGFEGTAQNSIFCRYESRKALATLEQSLADIPGGLTAERALKVAQDYVRETVTHEVGHTLGLRHNFAGSLATNIVMTDRKAIFSQYLVTGHATDEVRTTSSIMDYEVFEESALMGDQISRQVGDLTYDRQALQHLYLNQDFATSPAFCTDSDLGKYQDCQQFDNGRNLLEGSSWLVQHTLDSVALSLMNLYIQNKAPTSLATPTLPTERVVLNPATSALTDMTPRFAQYRAFTKAGQLISVRSQYPFISSLNASIVKTAEENYLKKTSDDFGGNLALFAPIAPNFADQAYAKFAQLLNTDGYQSGTLAGKPYSFSDADKAIMLANAKLYMTRLQEELTNLDLLSLSGAAAPKDPSAPAEDDDGSGKSTGPSPISAGLGDSLLPVMTSRVEAYVFPVTDQVIAIKLSLQPEDDAKAGDPVKTVDAKLPQFKYPFKVRLAAASLLVKGHVEDAAWAYSERIKYANQLNKLINESLGASLDKIDQSSLNHDAALWVMQNAQILSALKGADSN